MASNISYTSILNKVAESLIATQQYESPEEVFRDLASAAVKKKITHYQKRIKRLERKYNTDFESFTARLQGKATPVEEDDWLAWRSARSMLQDWQKIQKEVVNESAR